MAGGLLPFSTPRLSASAMLFSTVLLILCFFAGGTEAFGAGNIASISTIEGSNWRHGDIEDTLLTLIMARVAAKGHANKKFDSLTIKRIYFGNWLRDYSQAIDVGSLKYANKNTIRIILWILSFMTFGYATGEFEVTEERLGVYRPEEHIDNPRDYADNEDARRYDNRLRGPVNEKVELAIDMETGMKNYIANERAGLVPAYGTASGYGTGYDASYGGGHETGYRSQHDGQYGAQHGPHYGSQFGGQHGQQYGQPYGQEYSQEYGQHYSQQNFSQQYGGQYVGHGGGTGAGGYPGQWAAQAPQEAGQGINTSAGLIKRLFGKSIELARSYGRTGDKKELYEAFRLLGTGLHCLEDFAAHSNYVELALRELGELSVFPHVGKYTEIDIHGRRVFPVVTGTFGGVDFLHSVLGELTDKAIQSEVQQLEETMAASAEKSKQDGGESSILRELLNCIPPGILGQDFGNEATTLEHKVQEDQQSGTAGGHGASSGGGWQDNVQAASEIAAQIYPFLEFHDRLMKAVSKALDKIPGLTAIIEKLSEAVNIFVFSLIAPYILPILSQVKLELATGSEEIIATSNKKQHIVFYDDYCTDPTHSMLSKDHFTNFLNDPAGKVASEIVRYVVPLLMQAWDDPAIDVNRTLDHIVQIFHHPGIRQYPAPHPGRENMFEAVRQWWQSKSENEKQRLRGALSSEGVQAGKNHKGGSHDSGHGCGKPIGKNPLVVGKSFGDMGGIITEAVHETLESEGGSGLTAQDKAALSGLLGFAGATLAGTLGTAEFQGKEKKEKKENKKKDSEYGYTAPGYGYSGAYEYGAAQEEYRKATENPWEEERLHSEYGSEHSKKHGGKSKTPGSFIGTGFLASIVGAEYKKQKKHKKKDYDEDYKEEEEEEEEEEGYKKSKHKSHYDEDENGGGKIQGIEYAKKKWKERQEKSTKKKSETKVYETKVYEKKEEGEDEDEEEEDEDEDEEDEDEESE